MLFKSQSSVCGFTFEHTELERENKYHETEREQNEHIPMAFPLIVGVDDHLPEICTSQRSNGVDDGL